MAGGGLYGKLPSEGDFVTRRLPWDFTSAWDDWLQQGLLASRAALGERWLQCYLSAPIWRFQLAPGVCGASGWRGLFFASVDRVGRYFPLTLAFPETGAPALASLSDAPAAWTALEDAALAGLAPTLPIADFDRLAEALALPPPAGADGAGARACFYSAGADDLPAQALQFDDLPPPALFVTLIAPGASPAPTAGSLVDLL